MKAALAVNQELITLYWEVGSKILLKQKSEGWGAKTIENLAKDLKASFPDMQGFSHRNLKYMVHFAKEYPDLAIRQQPVAQIPWGHNILLLQKLTTIEERLWYANKTIENGWSRNVLLHWLGSKLHQRAGKSTTNFQATLPSPQSDLAHQTLKDPYNFDFLTLREKHDEQELESALLDHVQKFLLELGAGFAFAGRQYPIVVAGDTYRLDLLFYHFKLHCFIVVELKATDFKPEFAGKMNFYLSAVDDLIRHPDDRPTIGLLLCKGKDKVVAEYALRDINKPIGISEYETTILESLPTELKGSLPTIEEIEQELEDKA
jgi:predicted nuclease of restriction endonuclease-like (RecB) superfamily